MVKKILSKLGEHGPRKRRQLHYEEPLSNQRIRLERISRLLRCDPDEAKELMDLMLEWLQSAGALTPKTAHLDKGVMSEIAADVSPEIKTFLMENGLCD